MKNRWFQASAVAAFLLVSIPAFAAGGSAEGGTNVNKQTMDLVEFERQGQVVRMDPKEFEGLYRAVEPKLAMLDERVPGLRRMLEAVMSEKAWFLTTKEFKPRNPQERRPILQDGYGVFFNIEYIKKASRTQLEQAFFHELVRGLVMREHREYPESVQDDYVEYLTPRLYGGADRPGDQILNDLDKVWIRKLESRELIANWIKESKALTRFERICEQELKGKNPKKLSSQEKKSLLVALKQLDPHPGKSGTWWETDARNIADKVDALNAARSLGLIHDVWPYEDRSDSRQIENAIEVCSNFDGIGEFMREMLQPIADPRVPRVNTIEDAERILSELNRSPSSVSAPVYVTNVVKKGDYPVLGNSNEFAGSDDSAARSSSSAGR